MKKVLITGAYGFIASHTIEELHVRGYEVIGLVRHIGKIAPEDQKPWHPDQLYLADLRDKEAVEKAVSMSNGVINLGGILGTQETVQNPYPSVDINIKGALNILEAAKIWKVPVIQIAVGNYFEKNSYSLTKTCTEGFVQMYARHNGVRANVVRAFNAFGERQKHYPVRKIVPSFITRLLDGQKIQIYGDGKQLMDMIYVKDVARILCDQLQLLDRPKTPVGQIYEAGTGVGLEVKHIAEEICRLLGKDLNQIEYLPMRPGESKGAVVVAKDPINYPYTDWSDSLARTIEWYKENYK